MSDDSRQGRDDGTPQLSPSQFSTFVISLGSSVLVNLGDQTLEIINSKDDDDGKGNKKMECN